MLPNMPHRDNYPDGISAGLQYMLDDRQYWMNIAEFAIEALGEIAQLGNRFIDQSAAARDAINAIRQTQEPT